MSATSDSDIWMWMQDAAAPPTILRLTPDGATTSAHVTALEQLEDLCGGVHGSRQHVVHDLGLVFAIATALGLGVLIGRMKD